VKAQPIGSLWLTRRGVYRGANDSFGSGATDLRWPRDLRFTLGSGHYDAPQ